MTKKKEIRVANAYKRKQVYDSLTVEQKIQSLDSILGKNKGAKKQREKLNKQLKDK